MANKDICTGCDFNKSKGEGSDLIECKHKDMISRPDDMFKEYTIFWNTGRSSLFFNIEAVENFQSMKEYAWPLQFDPKVIKSCEGRVIEGKKK